MKTMFAVEIDNRHGRCYAMEGGWTTANAKNAFLLTSREAIEHFAKQFTGKNPKVVEVKIK